MSLAITAPLFERTMSRVPMLRYAHVPVLLAVASVPLILSSEHWSSVERTAATYGVLALGYAVVLGLCGQFTMAHAALYGIGAYTVALLTTSAGMNAWLTLPVAMAAAGVAGGAVGLAALRVRGDRLAIVTLAMGQLAQLIMLGWTPVTGGFAGISDVPPLTVGASRLIDEQSLAIIAVVLMLLALALFIRIRDSRLGLAFQSIREDEVLATANGVRVGRTKLAAFAISGVFAGAAGWLEATAIGAVSPTAFDVVFSVLVAAMVLIAGAGRGYAVVAAAAFIAITQDLLDGFPAVEVAVIGLLMVVTVMVRTGVLPMWRRVGT